MNLLSIIDQVDSVLPADGWRPGTPRGEYHLPYIICHFSFFISRTTNFIRGYCTDSSSFAVLIRNKSFLIGNPIIHIAH
jgi:hypothetical protein